MRVSSIQDGLHSLWAGTCLWKRTAFLPNGRRANAKSLKHLQYLYNLYISIQHYAPLQCSWPRSHTVLGKLLALAHFKVPVDWRLKIAHYVFIDIFSPRLRFSGTNPGFEAWSTLKFGWIEDWRFAAIFDPVGFQACLFQTDDCWISLRLVKSPSKTREEGGSYCKTIKLMWSPQQEIAKLHWSTTDQELDKAWDNALTTKAWSNGQVWSFSPEPYWRVTSEALTACWSWRDSLQHSIE